MKPESADYDYAQNVAHHQIEQGQRDLIEALRELGALLAAAPDVETMLDCLSEHISRVVPNDVSNVMLIEGDSARVVRWQGYDRFNAEGFIRLYSSPLARSPLRRRMIETGQPVIIFDRRTDPAWVWTPKEMEWLRSYASAPICLQGEAIGFLNVGSATPGFFDPLSADCLQALAGQAAQVWDALKA